MLLIGGGLLATSLAAIQAAWGGGHVWLAVIQTVLTGLLAVLPRSRRAQYGYLSAGSEPSGSRASLSAVSTALAACVARFVPPPGRAQLNRHQAVDRIPVPDNSLYI